MYKIDTSARYAISISARQDNILMMMIHRERINAAQGFALINIVLTPLFEGQFCFLLCNGLCDFYPNHYYSAL